MDLVKILSERYMKPELPEMNVGDTVRVLVRVKEGNRERTQAFEGTIIAKKHGGINETITVRRISYGVGCEKVFPVQGETVIVSHVLWRLPLGDAIKLIFWETPALPGRNLL